MGKTIQKTVQREPGKERRKDNAKNATKDNTNRKYIEDKNPKGKTKEKIANNIQTPQRKNITSQDSILDLKVQRMYGFRCVCVLDACFTDESIQRYQHRYCVPDLGFSIFPVFVHRPSKKDPVRFFQRIQLRANTGVDSVV